MSKKRQIIDAEYERDAIITWIKTYFCNSGNESTKAVIGISGGKDSAIAAALLVRALGPERVIGVLMPNGLQKDIDDAYRVCEALGIKTYLMNIGDACAELYESFINRTELPLSRQIETNTPARLRMTVLYMIAAAVGGRVCNTDNASERYIGYFTKYGDGAGDFALFSWYYVREVLAIGHTLSELPADLIDKAPADGMCGKTDEDNIGFTYETLDSYLLGENCPDYVTLCRIQELHRYSGHKINSVTLPCPNCMSRHDEDKEWFDSEVIQRYF